VQNQVCIEWILHSIFSNLLPLPLASGSNRAYIILKEVPLGPFQQSFVTFTCKNLVVRNWLFACSTMFRTHTVHVSRRSCHTLTANPLPTLWFRHHRWKSRSGRPQYTRIFCFIATLSV